MKGISITKTYKNIQNPHIISLFHLLLLSCASTRFQLSISFNQVLPTSESRQDLLAENLFLLLMEGDNASQLAPHFEGHSCGAGGYA